MKKFGLGVILAAGMAALTAGSAVAADLSTPVYKAPVVEEAQSPWQIRVRALYVMPEDGGSVNGIWGSDLTYSNAVVPELDITYYFTKNIAAELILGVTPHDINGAGSISGLGQVGKVWLLPPTLTLQYHFTDFGPFKPYLGAGVNYTAFFSQEATNPAFAEVKVKDSWGLALQAGFDWMIDKHWGFNVDVKKIFLQPDFTLQTVGGAYITGTADLNPWIFGTGVTYRF
ncbi:OmpW family protein [Xanthobacter dioxanivorans]|uniref:OmpW family protein n=1 Tax=Xanthobacter dioxanivorans TaxID=2528964 RepID=A0A974PQ49_9HYPH|nr:OmpW family protein [Xanthobacter dioxanivorans]QRG07692.1 OmpW family protein [Xanthobacter dioxanivorans]